MTKGMNDFCFLHQTGIFECITKDENGNLVIDPNLSRPRWCVGSTGSISKATP